MATWVIGNEKITSNNFDNALKEYNRKTGSNLPTRRTPRPTQLDAQRNAVNTNQNFVGNNNQGNNNARTFASDAGTDQELSNMMDAMPASQFNQYTLSQLENLIRINPPLANNARVRGKINQLRQETQQGQGTDANVAGAGPTQAQQQADMINNMPASQFNQYTLPQLQNLMNTVPGLANNPRIMAAISDMSGPRKPSNDAENNQVRMYGEYDDAQTIGAKTLGAELGVDQAAVRGVIRTLLNRAYQSNQVTTAEILSGDVWSTSGMRNLAAQLAPQSTGNNRIVFEYLANGNFRGSNAVSQPGSSAYNAAEKARQDANSSVNVATARSNEGFFDPQSGASGAAGASGASGASGAAGANGAAGAAGANGAAGDDPFYTGSGDQDYNWESGGQEIDMATWDWEDNSAFGRERGEFPGAFSGFLETVMPAGVSSPYARRQARRARDPLLQSFMLGTGLGHIQAPDDFTNLANLSLPQWLSSLENPFSLQNVGGQGKGFLDLVREAGNVLGSPSMLAGIPQGIGSGFMNWLGDNPDQQQEIAIQAGLQGVPTWMRGHAAQGLQDLSNKWLVNNPQGNLLTSFVNQGMRF